MHKKNTTSYRASIEHGLGGRESLADNDHQRGLGLESLERARHRHRVHVGQKGEAATRGGRLRRSVRVQRLGAVQEIDSQNV